MEITTESAPAPVGGVGEPFSLGYATPERRTGRGGAGAMVAITVFVGLASLGIFAISSDAMRRSGDTLWPAAAAVTALAAMATGFGYFLTRPR